MKIIPKTRKFKKKKIYAVFYEIRGQVYGWITHLGIYHISSGVINLYTDKENLKEAFRRAVQLSRQTEDNPKYPYQSLLNKNYHNGRVFIARLNSKDFPAEIDPNSIRYIGSGDKLRVPMNVKKMKLTVTEFSI